MINKRSVFVFIAAVFIIMVSVISFAYTSNADSRDTAPAAKANNALYVGMPKEHLFKLYNPCNIKEYDKSGNKEFLVFDNVTTSDSDDTITFQLVDGKVTEWNKRKFIFPDDKKLKSTIFVGMSKKDLFDIYHPGNLIKYEKKDDGVVMVFDDILSSDPNDKILFYLVDDKVEAWKECNIDPKEYEIAAAAEAREEYAPPCDSQGLMASKEANRMGNIRSESWGGWGGWGGRYY